VSRPRSWALEYLNKLFSPIEQIIVKMAKQKPAPPTPKKKTTAKKLTPKELHKEKYQKKLEEFKVYFVPLELLTLP
jgi:hypothetical protein